MIASEKRSNTWSINGRFLSQRVTGVQRYAFELTHALGELLGHNGSELGVEIAASENFKFEHSEESVGLPVRQHGRSRGQIWEQFSLPRVSSSGVLSLCNTGPIFRRNHIVCIHDVNVFEWPQSYSRAFRSYYKTILPILGRQSYKILTVSKTSADLLVQKKIAPASKIEVVPNGHEHVFRWDASKSALADTAISDRPFVLAIGSRAPHKNIQLIYKIADELDQMGIDIYLSGAAVNIFTKEDSGTKAPRNLRHLGYVSDDDLALLYSRALCLLFPSYVEGFGLPLVEAMAFGCPIVSSDTSCMPEICGPHATLLSPEDPSAWADSVAAIQRLGRSNRTNAVDNHLQNFSWKGSAEIVCSILEAAR